MTQPADDTLIRATLAAGIHGSLTVVVHNEARPHDEDWAVFLKWYDARAGRLRASLVYSAGGMLDGSQRKKLEAAMRKHGQRVMPTAVLSEGVLFRMVLKTMSWLNPAIRGFPPRDVEAALAYLEVPLAEHTKVRAVLDHLRSRLLTPSAAARF